MAPLRSLRRAVRPLLDRTGLISLYYRNLERRLARQPSEAVDDGRPMPPPELLVLVCGTTDQRWFSEQGRRDAVMFAGLAADHGIDLRGGATVVDWGVGCGRIARWLAAEVEAGGGRFIGSDLNPKLVAWARESLPGAYHVNGLMPPLALGRGEAVVVYSYSVLTHLREKACVAWLAEVARVLKPGGVALLTFHDEHYATAYGPPGAAEALARQPYAVLNDAMEGSNYLSSWISQTRFRELASPWFDVETILPGGRDGPNQAVAVLRRRADGPAAGAA